LKKENYVNLKTQCYYKMSKRINDHGIAINTENPQIKEWIIEELEQVKAKDVDKDKKLSIIGKDEIKERIGRSPDFSDMMAMREWFELMPKPSITVIHM
jgi:phage terminase large subunit